MCRLIEFASTPGSTVLYFSLLIFSSPGGKYPLKEFRYLAERGDMVMTTLIVC